jgi:hypothetical protein
MRRFLLSLSFLAIAGQEARAEEELPIYFAARSSVATPFGGHGQIPCGGISFGMPLDSSGKLLAGMRAIYILNPPPNPLSKETPDVPWGWGPVVDIEYHPKGTTSKGFFFKGTAGYIYGIPENTEENNLVLPIIEGGVGIRIVKNLSDTTKVFFSPDMGMVPGLWAPYAGLTIGILQDGTPL